MFKALKSTLVIFLIFSIATIAFGEINPPKMTPAQEKRIQEEENLKSDWQAELDNMPVEELKKLYDSTGDWEILRLIEDRYEPTVNHSSLSRTVTAEVEPNDDYTTANVMMDSMSAEIGSAADVDFFSFSAVAGFAYNFETGPLPGSSTNSGDTQIRIYDTDGTTQLVFNDDGGTGLYSLATLTVTVDGTYYVKVNPYGASNVGDYLLTYTYGGPCDDYPDANEPNDTYITATAITPGTITASMCDAGDVDYYSFSATAGQIVSFAQVSEDPSFDFGLWVVDADSVEVLDVDYPDLTGSFVAPTTGSYTLVIGYWYWDGGSSTTSKTNYSFDLTIVDPPNDSPYMGVVVINEIMQNPSAASDSYGEYIELVNLSATDVDVEGWTLKDNDYEGFVLHGDTTGLGYSGAGGSTVIPAGGYLVLCVSADPLINGNVVVDYGYGGYGTLDGMTLGNSSDEVMLWDADSMVVDEVWYDNGATFPDPTGASMEFNPDSLAAGDNNNGAAWYASVLPFGDGDLGTPGGANTDGIFDCDLAGYPDAYEPNDTYATAAAIVPGTVTAAICDVGDVDYYTFSASAGQTITFGMVAEDYFDFGLWVVDADSVEVLDADDPDLEGSFVAPTTGTYTVVIGYYGWDSGWTTSYKTTYSFSFAMSAVPTLLFSEFIEGSSNHKAFEIYNGTGADVDLADYLVLGNYNGNPFNDTLRFPIGTTLADGDVYVVAHEYADAVITAVADTLIEDPYAGGTSYIAVFNGDDVRGLFYMNGTDTTLIDLFGWYDIAADTSTDPGSGWDVAGVAAGAKDHTVVRKADIVQGNTDWTASAGTDADNSEWVVFDQNTFRFLGTHPHTDYYEPNNDIANAYPIAIGDTLLSNLLVDPVNDVDYFSFAGNAGDMITIDMFIAGYSNLDGEVALLGVDSTQLITVDAGGSGSDEQIFNFTLPDTGTYYIVTGYYGDVARAEAGNYGLGISYEAYIPLQGEVCADPFLAVTGVNSAAQQPVWYEYTATIDGIITISSCIAGQSEDTRLYVYDGCDGTQVAYNDDIYCAEYSYASEVSFAGVAGTSYKLYWDDYWDNGPIDFTLTEEIATYPDLTITDVVWDPNAMTLSYNWNNVGDADAGFHYSSIWINNTNWPVHCGYPYGDIEYSITGLVAMTTEPVVVDLSDLTFGDYEIYVTVDNDCIVAESNEDNNETGPILFTIDPPATPSQLTATAGVEDIGLNWLAIPPAPARLAGPENAVFGEMSNRLLEGTSYAVETAPTRNKINPIQAEKELLELEMAPKLLEQYASRDGGPACDSALVAVAGTNQSNHTGGVEQWFSYTATLDGQITVSTCDLTTEDTYVIAYAACADWGPSYPYGTPIVTSDDFCSMQSEATISCIAGETYYFWWRSVYASGSTYDWTLTEAAGSPDLLASDFWYDPVDDALRIEVVNIGDLDAGGFYVDWYLTNPVPDSCGDYGGGYNAYTYSSSLTAGDTVIHSVTGAQAFMGYGSFTFGAYVDDDCMVDESVETNNSITGDFTFINPLEGVVWNIYRDGTYLDSTSTNPNYTDYAVMGGTEYCYYVTEMLPDTTESDTSNHACATPMIAGLCSVQDLAATDEVGAVTLTWSEPYMPLIADFIIDAIPYDDVNNNIGATDDFDVSGSDGADIAYSFTTVDSIALFITLCDSVTDYDTKIEVFAANGTSLAYNDDGPFGLCPEATLAPYTPSEIGSVAFGPGTYIIVVDGYSGEEGNYGLHVTEATTSRDVANIETLQYAREKALSIGYTMEQFLEMSRDVDPACGEHLGYSVQDAAGTELLFTVDEFATFDSLAPGEYCYQVVTVYDEGNAVASNVACATALAPPMPMITIVSPADSATVTYATVDIAFEVENFVTGGGARTTGAQPTGTENQLRTKGPHNGNILAKPAHADRDLVMLSQNDGLGVNGYFQSWGSGYGVVFDLTPYEGVTLEAIDFSHSSWGLTGNWPYAVHLVDMVSMTAISVVEGLTTTVNDDWELDVALGSVPAGISLVGVFVEPLGNAAEDAYPDVDFDVALDGDSRVVDLADYSTLQVAGGDFIIDLWINADPGEVDGHIAVTLNNEPYGEHFTSDPVTISGLVAGENTIKLELVDNDGNPLDPSADDSITLFYVNTPPNAFNLLAPIHEDTLYLTPDNVGMNTLFAWMPSTDPEGAQVWYHVAGTLVELAEPYELDTTGTAVFVSNTDLFNDIDGGGLAGVTIEWNVTASDGIDETASGNGPFTVYIDISALLGVGDEALIPDVFALHQNYPNPFNPTTRIEYDIPEISNVQITVYNVMGQKVRTLVNTEHSPGYHSVLWNGTNEFGSPVSSGMYFYQIKANNFNKVKKLVLMK